VLIDGDIIAIDSKGRTSFSSLKTGIDAGMPLEFYAFDLLELEDKDLADLRSRLESRSSRTCRRARPGDSPDRRRSRWVARSRQEPILGERVSRSFSRGVFTVLSWE
jgi:hypothetical protein